MDGFTCIFLARRITVSTSEGFSMTMMTFRPILVPQSAVSMNSLSLYPLQMIRAPGVSMLARAMSSSALVPASRPYL